MSTVGKQQRMGAPQQRCRTEDMPSPVDARELESRPQVIGSAYWRWDVEAGCVIFSPEWRRILHQPKDTSLDYSFTGWWPRLHKDDLSEMQKASEDILSGRSEHINLLFRMLRDDGCWAWLLNRGTVAARDGNGRPAIVEGIVTDVSDLRMDSKFQHAQAGAGGSAYHAMLENSPDLVVRMDRELFPLYVNPNVARYMERERYAYSFTDGLEELKLDPRQLEFLKKNVGRVFDEGIAVREMVTFTTSFGEEVTGEYSFWPEFDGEGNVTAAMTQFRDLTEQVEAEKRARLNERRLDALYRLTQMTDAPEEEIMRFVLNSLIQLTGSGSGFIFIPNDEVTGPGHMVWSDDHYEHMEPRFLPNDRFPEDLKILTTGKDGKPQYRSLDNGDGVNPVHVSFEGRMKVMRTVIAPGMENGKVVCIAGVCNKLSDYNENDLQQLELFINGAWLVLRRHNYIQELRRAKEAAEHANKVKDEFLANVSHELRTPLNGLLSMLQLLDFLSLSEQQREYVRTANLSGKALLRIISDILDFSRMESGKMDLQSEPFDLKQTVVSTVSLFRGEAENKGLEFELSIDERIPGTLLGDDARVRQIIFNLVGNALKFTEQGRISVECVQEAEIDSHGSQVLISVKDTGIGIPHALQSVIFEAFTQVDSSSTRKYPGTGLGLGIVKRLVSMMRGNLWIESEVGKGTEVFCRITFQAPQTAFRQKPGEAEHEDAPLLPLDILVAEDDDVGRFAMRSFLLRLGQRPVCVPDGRQALEALKLYPFHCLFTDIQMPDMDGMELVRRIREGKTGDIEISRGVRELVKKAFPADAPERNDVPPDIAVVAISAHAMAGDKERFLREGMDYYISKPIVAEEMSAVLKKIGARIAAKEKG